MSRNQTRKRGAHEQQNLDPKWYTVSLVASLLGFGETKVRRLIISGDLRSLKDGRSRRGGLRVVDASVMPGLSAPTPKHSPRDDRRKGGDLITGGERYSLMGHPTSRSARPRPTSATAYKPPTPRVPKGIRVTQ
jgi:excisionase family DNA binding protein